MKYPEGTRVVIKEDVSRWGDYGPYAGQAGEITEHSGWDSSIRRITLDDGTVLRHVGYSVIEKEDVFTSRAVTTTEGIDNRIEDLKEEIQDRLDEIDELRARQSFMMKYDLDEYDPAYHKADQVVNNMESNASHEDKVKAIAKLFSCK